MTANNSLYKLETTLNCFENSATKGKPVVTGSLISQRYTDLFLVVFELWEMEQETETLRYPNIESRHYMYTYKKCISFEIWRSQRGIEGMLLRQFPVIMV